MTVLTPLVRSSLLGIMLGGLVVGFSLVMINPPQNGLASPVPTTMTTQLPRSWWPERVTQVSAPEQKEELLWELPAEQLSYQQRRQYLVDQTVVLPVTKQDLSSLVIGDELQLTASTNGVYHFTVLEVRTGSLEEIALVAQANPRGLLLTQSTSWLHNQFLVVVAKPPSQ